MATVPITESFLKRHQLAAGVDRERIWDASLPGYGVIVGQLGVSFVVKRRVGGSEHATTITIGRWGSPGVDGADWTEPKARKQARIIIGQIDQKIDPRKRAGDGTAIGGPTVREALGLHVSSMRKRELSPRSIETIETEVLRLLEEWLDRPLLELRGVDLVDLHDAVTEENGKSVANRLIRHVSAIWNAADKVHEFEARNPAKAVTHHKYKPRRQRVDDEAMPQWWTRVQTLSPVRRDFRIFVATTGMRAGAARAVRWEHLDERTGALRVPKPKGGEDRAFTLPLAPRVLAMLVQRKNANAADPILATLGGDHGWAFPSLSRDLKRVQPLAESKEYRLDEKTGKRIQFLPGPHVSRATFMSIASEIGISELDRSVLANHSFGTKNVNASYIAQSFEHLQGCATRIEEALWSRMKPKRGAKLRAV